MSNRIFISYATEDYQYSDKLHSFLVANGYEPWMDKKNLLPGQRWDMEIRKALREADFLLLLLSSTSVNKRGYVQREFNLAVNYAEEKLDSDIYIIPIKIDSCETPEKLNKFQWIEYNSTDAFEKILISLNIQRNIIQQESKSHNNELEIKEFISKETLGIKSPKQIYDIKYLQFVNNKDESLLELNNIIYNEALLNIIDCRNEYYDNLKNYIKEEEESMFNANSETFAEFDIKLKTNNIISYTSFWSIYKSGAAHEYYFTTGHNYFLNPLRKFDFENLFDFFYSILEPLRDIVEYKLLKGALEEKDIEKDNFYIYDNGFEAKEDNFSNYYIKNKSVFFIYNPYHFTAWSYGAHHVEVTFAELIQVFPNEKKLIEFVNTNGLI